MFGGDKDTSVQERDTRDSWKHLAYKGRTEWVWASWAQGDGWALVTSKALMCWARSCLDGLLSYELGC